MHNLVSKDAKLILNELIISYQYLIVKFKNKFLDKIVNYSFFTNEMNMTSNHIHNMFKNNYAFLHFSIYVSNLHPHCKCLHFTVSGLKFIYIFFETGYKTNVLITMLLYSHLQIFNEHSISNDLSCNSQSLGVSIDGRYVSDGQILEVHRVRTKLHPDVDSSRLQSSILNHRFEQQHSVGQMRRRCGEGRVDRSESSVDRRQSQLMSRPHTQLVLPVQPVVFEEADCARRVILVTEERFLLCVVVAVVEPIFVVWLVKQLTSVAQSVFVICEEIVIL